MVASYSELYEEGEVEYINGPTHPPLLEVVYIYILYIYEEESCNEEAYLLYNKYTTQYVELIQRPRLPE